MNVVFTARGAAHSLHVTLMTEAQGAPMVAAAKPGAKKAAAGAASFDALGFVKAMRRSHAMQARIPAMDIAQIGIVTPPTARATRRGAGRAQPDRAMTIVTPSIIVEGARRDDLAAAKNAGATVVHEGLDGKALLALDDIQELSRVLALLTKREVGSVTPNFLRRYARLPRSAATQGWAHGKIGVARAWKVTKGASDVSIAVLDEGVDTKHPALRAAVVGERDFIGDNGNSAMPDGNDAHGTACAGIIVARGKTAGGIAPKCSLLAARIAMDDGTGHWVFDDYATADAIDWSWRSGAAVLSNSWGGGLPSDAISRAFGRARTQGRGGKGAVVCIAAGNDQAPIDFPGDLPGYVTVGASNPKDERKTRTSSDGENWWGSNHGPTMWLLAPGVFIHTPDISGAAGYDPGDYTTTFNGTSAATPHVAAAAALMIAINPRLAASDVRMLLSSSAKRIAGQTGFTNELGHGRLDIGAAVVAAKKHA